MTPIDILSDLRESNEDYENAVLATFSFSPIFFEGKILPILISKDISNIVLLADPIDYETTFKEAKQIGVFYLVEPISIRDSFHPKFLLLTSKETGKLVIGSANITQEGYTSNAEILTSIDFDKSNPSDEALSIFIGMKAFLKRLIQKGFVKSEKHTTKLLEAINLPWMIDQQLFADKIKLVHNLDTSIIEQLRRNIEEEVQKVTISSFLFSTEVIRYICDNFCKNVNICIQPKRVIGLLKPELEHIIKETGADLTFTKVILKDGENRFLHAKIIVIQTPKGSYCLTGSANLTKAALLSTANSGNVEMCLLRFEPDRKYFDYLFNNNSISTERINLDDISPVSTSAFSQIVKPDLELTEAKIENGNLILQFSPVDPCFKLARLTIKRAVAVESKILNTDLKEKDRICVSLIEDLKRYCQDSCYVVLELRRDQDDLKPLVSNKRWISTEIAELIPSNRDVETIRKSDGRFGLIKLLSQLDKATDSPEMFLYYISFIDFEWLYETVGRARKHIVRTADSEIHEDQKFMLDRLRVTPNYVLERILGRHMKKFENLTSEIENTQDLPAKVEKIFNLFMFINKIILWFVLRKKCAIHELRYICGCTGTIDIFCGKYLDELREVLGNDGTNRLMDRLNALVHVAFLSKIIREIQRNDPIYEQKNAGPVGVFNEVYEKSLKNLCVTQNIRDEIVGKVTSGFATAKNEYDEFQTFKLEMSDILSNALKIVGIKF